MSRRTSKTSTKTAKTSTVLKSSKVIKEAKARPAANDTAFRVVRLTAPMREAIAKLRSKECNNQTVIQDAVNNTLPQIIKALVGLGCNSLTQPSKSYRLPFSTDTIAALKDGSEATGIPAAHLLLLCFSSLSTKKGGK